MAPKRDNPQRATHQPGQPLPKTTVEAVDLLLELIPVEEQRRIAATPEQEFRVLAHFALGLWIRNHFIGPGNPELCAACQTEHPDQISAAILDVLWERLQDDPPADPGGTGGRKREAKARGYARLSRAG